jgi:hypothetical protein
LLRLLSEPQFFQELVAHPVDTHTLLAMP